MPDRVRNPIGRVRREIADRLTRGLSPEPLPPRELLLRVQLTGYVREYLEVGSQIAETLLRVAEHAGFPPNERARLLDLGCGCSRVTRHLTGTAWQITGCDIDADAIAWSERCLPAATFVVNDEDPPLPLGDREFEIVIAVSLFTHLPLDRQGPWAAEVARVTKPGGIAVVTTMGPAILAGSPTLATEQSVSALHESGLFSTVHGPAFNQRAVFHTRRGLEDAFGCAFTRELTLERHIGGFQDLSLFRRRS